MQTEMFDAAHTTTATPTTRFLPGFDHFKRTVDIVVTLLRQINLLRCLLGGIGNEIMLALHLVFCKLVQRNNIVLRFFASKDTFCERM